MRSRPAPASRWLRLVLTVSVAGMLAVPLRAGVVVTSAAGGLTKVGSVSYGEVPGSGAASLTVDPGTRRGFMLPGTAIVVRVLDLASGRVITDLPFPGGGRLMDGTATTPGVVVDSAHHRIIYPIFSDFVCDAGVGSQQALAELDTVTLQWRILSLPCAGTVFTIEGLTKAADPDTAFVLGYRTADDSGFEAETGQAMELLKVRLSDGGIIWDALLAPPCRWGDEVNADFSGEPAMFDMRTGAGREMVVECGEASSNAETSADTQQAIVVTFPLDSAGRPSLDSTGRPAGLTQTVGVGERLAPFADPDAGLISFASDITAFGYGAYVFDARAHLFRGMVASGGGNQTGSTDQPRQFGYDVSRGRFYMRNAKALFVSDVRHQPLPPGLPYPELADTYTVDHPDRAEPHTVLGVDPVRHLLYLPDYATSSFLVYRDDIPDTPPATPFNVDAATSDIPETAGKTAVTYSGSANAFGLHALSEGGLTRTAYGLMYGAEGNEGAGPFNCCPLDDQLTPGDRDWYVGHVDNVALTNNGASADSAAMDLSDSATQQDLHNHGVSGSGGLDDQLGAAGVRPWDHASQCQDFGGSAASPPPVSSDIGTSSVHCDQAQADVAADAAFSEGTDAAALSGIVGSYEAHADTERDPKLGEVTHVVAVARHLTFPIPGAPVSIGEIRTEATTSAHGRPHTAAAVLERSIQGFVSPSYTCTADCDPARAADALTGAFQTAGILAVASAPPPDAAYFPSGSPGGYQAVVTKDAATEVSERAVNDDPTDTVVGLQIVFFTDNLEGRSRQILQFAGVHAESHYGIFAIDSGAGSTPTAGSPTVPTAPSGAASATSPPLAGPGQETAHTAAPSSPRTIVEAIARGMHDIWSLVVSNPRAAAALALTWLLLLTPVYLAIRRRSLRAGEPIPTTDI